jgi:hypothetical protein
VNVGFPYAKLIFYIHHGMNLAARKNVIIHGAKQKPVHVQIRKANYHDV